DGHIVLMHDEKVDRTTNGKGNVADMTLAELQHLDAGSWKNPKFRGEPVPSLSQIAEVCRGKSIMMLDLKCPGQGPALAEWMRVNQYPADQITLAPWTTEEGAALRKHLPDPPMILIVEEILPPADDSYFRHLKQTGFGGLSIEWKILTPRFI